MTTTWTNGTKDTTTFTNQALNLGGNQALVRFGWLFLFTLPGRPHWSNGTKDTTTFTNLTKN